MPRTLRRKDDDEDFEAFDDGENEELDFENDEEFGDDEKAFKNFKKKKGSKDPDDDDADDYEDD